MKKLLAVIVLSLLLLVAFAAPALAWGGSLPPTGDSGVEGEGSFEDGTLEGSITLPEDADMDSIGGSLEVPNRP